VHKNNGERLAILADYKLSLLFPTVLCGIGSRWLWQVWWRLHWKTLK